MNLCHLVLFNFWTGASPVAAGGEEMFGPHLIMIPDHGIQLIKGSFA